jgi:Ni,Fe-hydrogenase I large subunit
LTILGPCATLLSLPGQVTWLETDQKYSWVKAPRCNDINMEVGPLARILVAHAGNHERVQYWVDAALIGTLFVNVTGLPFPYAAQSRQLNG